MSCNAKSFCQDAGMAKSRRGKLSSIQVDQPVAARFKEICGEMPMSPSMSRVAAGLVDWFGRQSNVVRMALVGGVPAGLERPVADALEALAAELRGRAKSANAAKVPDEGLVIVHPPEQASPRRRRPPGREQS
jgi:hypothetical protein